LQRDKRHNGGRFIHRERLKDHFVLPHVRKEKKRKAFAADAATSAAASAVVVAVVVAAAVAVAAVAAVDISKQQLH